jgi:NYN domain
MTQSPLNSALFIDFDNVITTLDRHDSDLGRRFATKPLTWLNSLEQNFEADGATGDAKRRIIARRCYASPHKINHHRQQFTQTGIEVIDCPPLTSMMKNSADIYVVMDIIDYMAKYPHIDEFIILSADADFVPVLNRLRKELKRSVIFTSYDTASAYRNCSDATIGAEFFRTLFASEAASTRATTSSTQSHQRGKLPVDFSKQVEDCLILAANKRLGKLPLATAAQVLREKLPDLIGGNWAGHNSLGNLIRNLKFITLQINWDNEQFLIPNFKLNLSEWGDDNNNNMSDFVFDILETAGRGIPLISPQAYTVAFESLAKAFNGDTNTLIEGINQAISLAQIGGHEISTSDMRYIASGVSMRGYHLDGEGLKNAMQIASKWRVNIYELCQRPEWLGEADDATLLGTWFHSQNETVADARRDFLDAISIGDVMTAS